MNRDTEREIQVADINWQTAGYEYWIKLITNHLIAYKACKILFKRSSQVLVKFMTQFTSHYNISVHVGYIYAGNYFIAVI